MIKIKEIKAELKNKVKKLVWSLVKRKKKNKSKI